jgi:hypothetical protein
MEKLILFNMVTVDGFFEGKNKELDWHNIDKQFNIFAIEQKIPAVRHLYCRSTADDDLKSSFIYPITLINNDNHDRYQTHIGNRK